MKLRKSRRTLESALKDLLSTSISLSTAQQLHSKPLKAVSAGTDIELFK